MSSISETFETDEVKSETFSESPSLPARKSRKRTLSTWGILVHQRKMSLQNTMMLAYFIANIVIVMVLPVPSLHGIIFLPRMISISNLKNAK